ncbi:MAG TPA: glycosyl transferase [Gammaproteobacteria bacterium]|nr:glycosyl transferase [Gammaproteobacteria bacterium]
MRATTQQLSVIIPALNEAGCIRELCTALQPLRSRGHEVILVDGGSDDQTLALGTPLVDIALSSARGRALQMRTGAAAANGTILWFLHADTGVPDSPDQLILEALENSRNDWGRFDVSLSARHLVLRGVAHLMNLRSCISAIATGDQGIFVRRSLYEQVGGIPPLPLMEDIALSRALKQHSRPACIRQRLVTSARRWQQHGITRTILTMWGLRLAYFIGISPHHLAKYYAANQESCRTSA